MQQVIVQADAPARMHVEDVLRLEARNIDGGMVPLSEVVKPVWGELAIATCSVQRLSGRSYIGLGSAGGCRAALPWTRWNGWLSRCRLALRWNGPGSRCRNDSRPARPRCCSPLRCWSSFSCWRRSMKAGRSRWPSCWWFRWACWVPCWRFSHAVRTTTCSSRSGSSPSSASPPRTPS